MVDQADIDHVGTATRENRKTITDDLRSIDFSTQGPTTNKTLDKGHGRPEERRCTVVDPTDPEWNDCGKLHGQRQVMRIDREFENLESGRIPEATAGCPTSLGKSGIGELIALVRHHRQIGTRLHHGSDSPCEEDRYRVRPTPRDPACLANIAIPIVHLQGPCPEPAGTIRNHRQETLDAAPSPPNRS